MDKSRLLRWGALVLLILSPFSSILGDSLKYTAFKGHENGAVHGFEKIDPEMFSAKPLPSLYYLETWFHDLIFEEQGIILNLNFQMNNLGVRKGYCDVFAMVSDPSTNGVIVERISFSPNEVKIADNGFGITAGPNRIELDGQEYRIKVETPKIKAVFTFKPLAGSFRQGDGLVKFSGSDDFFYEAMPIPWAEVSGVLTYNGKTHTLKGHGSLNHEWQRLSPENFMSRVRVMYLYNDDSAIRISNVSSKNLDGQWIKALLVADRKRVLFSSDDFNFEESDVRPVPGAKVACPRLFKVSAVHGNDRLEGEIKVVAIQEKKSILEDYNVFFRQIASLIINETWSYRFWATYDFTLTFNGKTREIRGKGVGNFLDSLESDKK